MNIFNQPTLFLGGAPKCGTSALFDLINQHPQIAGSRPKETFFFLDAGHPLLNINCNTHQSDPSAFQQFFTQKNTTKWLLEGSTHLLYQEQMIETLNREFNQVKLLFILRNPVQRLRSSFEYTQNNLARFTKPLSFETYADMLLSGRENILKDYILEGPSRFVLQRDLQYGQYIDFLQKWLAVFRREQVKVIVYEDLKNDQVWTVSEIWNWLGLEAAELQVGNGHRNRTHGIKYKKLHRKARQLAENLPVGPWKQWAKKAYYAWQGRGSERVNVKPEIFDRLQAYYQPFNQRLAQFLGRELPGW